MRAFVPNDRRGGRPLADRTTGAALLADLSGFTAFTEQLVERVGARRGAEELARVLETTYTALLDPVFALGGSVVSFAGDGVTCWFEADNGVRAAASGLAIARAAAALGTFGVRVGIGVGSARRFLVGDPSVQRLDVLAGAAVASAADCLARAAIGEVRISRDVAGVERDDERVLAITHAPTPASPWPEVADEDELRSWLPPVVRQRLRAGAELLPELRPAVALFVSFAGVDLEADDAGVRLDRFVRFAQAIAARADGALFHVDAGEKGTHLLLGFGAPIAHEDDPLRAVSAGLELRDVPEDLASSIRLGVSQGVVWCGAYGARTRCVYGLLGDEVNVAARLMARAAPGELVAGGRIERATHGVVEWRPLGLVTLKGKREPAPVFGAVRLRTRRLPDETESLGLVGRDEELERLSRLLDGATTIAIVGDAGIGKSRFLAEALRLTETRGRRTLVTACAAHTRDTPYAPWRAIVGALFEVEPGTLAERAAEVVDRLAAIDPLLAPRAPLLGTLFGEPMPDTELTSSLDARARKDSLEELVVSILADAARRRQLTLAIEDTHWIDAASRDLAVRVGRGVDAQVLVLMTRRPDGEDVGGPTIVLGALAPRAARLLVERTLVALGRGTIAVNAIAERAQGNAFFLEELARFAVGEGADLPDTVQRLLLSRIDRLEADERAVLRIASVAGRRVRPEWLADAVADVAGPLARLVAAEILAHDPVEQGAFVFRHALMQEAAYEALPEAIRADLHQRLGARLEREAAPIDLLAYHFARGSDPIRARTYLRRAGDAAHDVAASATVIACFGRLLELTTDAAERADLLEKLAIAYERVGDLERADAAAAAAAAAGTVRATILRSRIARTRGDFDEAQVRLAPALDAADVVVRATALIETAWIHMYRGTIADAYRILREAIHLDLPPRTMASVENVLGVTSRRVAPDATQAHFERALSLARASGHRYAIPAILNNIALDHLQRGDLDSARTLLEECLVLHREIGSVQGILHAVSNLGLVAAAQGRFVDARALFVERTSRSFAIGDRLGVATGLLGVGASEVLANGEAQGVRCLAAADGLARQVGAVWEVDEQQLLDRAVARARERLGTTFDEAWREGLAADWQAMMRAVITA